ncbi:MAG: type II 3-dehydroquinate dehydratase [Alphaproteobacteria bacterium]|nr:MAG: type II 3-dehydroquinate dehydratase [Alphaproteobacteria bacterium]
MAGTIFILNGPNLNLLGQREVDVYGATTLAEIEAACRDAAAGLGFEIDFRQTNQEGELVTWIQEAREKAVGLVINAAAYTHSSYAIPDALATFEGTKVEVHLSNIFKREEFRHHSTLSNQVDGVICGLGPQGYVLAIEAIAEIANS